MPPEHAAVGTRSIISTTGAIVNRTYGTHKKLYILPIFTSNIWSYLLWSPVIGIVLRVPGYTQQFRGFILRVLGTKHFRGLALQVLGYNRYVLLISISRGLILRVLAIPLSIFGVGYRGGTASDGL